MLGHLYLIAFRGFVRGSKREVEDILLSERNGGGSGCGLAQREASVGKVAK